MGSDVIRWSPYVTVCLFVITKRVRLVPSQKNVCNKVENFVAVIRLRFDFENVVPF